MSCFIPSFCMPDFARLRQRNAYTLAYAEDPEKKGWLVHSIYSIQQRLRARVYLSNPTTRPLLIFPGKRLHIDVGDDDETQKMT